MHPIKIPLKKQWLYAIGQLGWSTLINIINLQLVFFYIPPDDSGIPYFITQIVFLGILNAVTLLAASGRILDAITDPWIANLSDKHKSPQGRRIPFMKWSALPAAIFCIMLFFPVSNIVSGWNIIWLVVMQAAFYIALTFYVTPYFALLPEFGHDAKTRLNLSTWISITYALGIVLASQTSTIGSILSHNFGNGTETQIVQFGVAAMAILATIFMLVPVWTIDENKYTTGNSSETDLKSALALTFKNKSFRYYVVADFSYFMGLTIVMTGLLYYITVLLGLEKSMEGILLPLLVLVSFLVYPVVNLLATKFGKKRFVVFAFLFMSIIFSGIWFLGKFSMDPMLQAYLLIICFALPMAFLGILPNAILADIAEHSAVTTGIRQEGMFFAARTLMQKFGQTFGVFAFAALTSLGKDIGDDLGIRLSGIIGAILCLIAGLYFMRYNEKELLNELQDQ